jgi:stage II sporulation protein D
MRNQPSVVLAAFFAILIAKSARAEEEIRIAIARVAGSATLSGNALKLEDVLTGREIAANKRTLVLGLGEETLNLAGNATHSRRLLVTGPQGVTYQGRTFRGRVEVLWHRHKGSAQLLLVHPLPIETYLVGIIAGELPPRWPPEAMKAQAVAARTYAVYQKFHAPDRPYHLDSGVLDQVYGGVQHETGQARDAVMATEGEVLTYQRRPIKAYFHACCGQQTESARDGWGTPEPYLPSVACGFCQDCGRRQWTLKVLRGNLAHLLRAKSLGVGDVRQLSVTRTTATGRAAAIEVHGTAGTQRMHAEDLRRILGYDQLRSRQFTVRTEGEALVFSGQGSGHAVGMCQWGARGKALAGSGYRDILTHYYPGARIQRMY